MDIIGIIKNKVDNLSVQAKASFCYMLASVLTKGINILTLPVYTRLLSTTEMGIVTGFNAWYSILYPIVTLSLATASLSVAMIDYKSQREKYQSVCLAISSISSLLFLLGYSILARPINDLTGMSAPLFLTQILLFMFNPALDSWYIKQRFEYKYKSVLIMSASITLLSVLVSIGAIYTCRDKGVSSLGTVRIISQNGVIVVFAIVIWVYIFIKGQHAFDLSMAKYALKLSVPLIIHSLAKNILDASDRLMITSLCGESDAGIYGTVYNISLMATIIWSAINSAIVPEMFSSLEKKDYNRIRKTTVRVLLIMGSSIILSTIIAPELLQVLTTKEYYSSVNIMPAVMIGVYFTAVYGLYGNVLMFYKKSFLVMIATIGAALVNIVSNYIFIKQFGYQAAAYTTFISFILLAVLELIMKKRVVKEQIIPIRFLVFFSISLILVCLCMIMIYPYRWLRLGIVLVCFIAALINKERIISTIKGG